MATTRQTEIERKYDVTGDGSLPDLSGVEGVDTARTRDAVELEAVYVDTERDDLARAAITMRRRTGGKDEGWHVKLPAGAGRTEVHAPLTDGTLEGDEVTPPGDLLDAVRAIVRGRALVPVARIRTRRTAVILSDASGAEVAEVADDAVTATDLRTGLERAWHEVEAELLGVDGDGDGDGGGQVESGSGLRGDALLDAIERVLRGAGAVPSASRSKLARALGRDDLTDTGGTDSGLTDTGSTDSGATDSRDADSASRSKATGKARGRAPKRGTALEAVAGSVRALTADLLAADPAVRSDDAGSVHEMRKVVRRLRSVLAAFRREVDREQADALRARLASLGGVLGAARDAEVRVARAAAAIDALPDAFVDRRMRARLVTNAKREYRRTHRRLVAFLSGPEYFALLDALDEFVADPRAGRRADRPAGKALRRALQREAERSLRRAGRAGRAGQAAEGGEEERAVEGGGGGDALDARHAARKAARRLRYAAEAASASGAIHPRADRKRVASLAAAAEAVQEALGDNRDAAVFAQHVLAESARAHEAGESTFGYGVLFVDAQRAAGDAEADARDAVRGLRRAAKKL